MPPPGRFHTHDPEAALSGYGFDPAADLYTYTSKVCKNDEPPFVLKYGFLHRLNLVHLQNELARCKGDIFGDKRATRAQCERLKELLSSYTNAIRDYEYLSKLKTYSTEDSKPCLDRLEHYFPGLANLHGDPFGSSYYLEINRGAEAAVVTDPIRNALRKALPCFLTYSVEEKKERSKAYQRREAPETISPFVDTMARFVLALLGGTALVFPMMIMIFDPSVIKSVVTVSVAVMLFSVALSLILRVSNSEIITATAAYAAVLVVFVGANGNTGISG